MGIGIWHKVRASGRKGCLMERSGDSRGNIRSIAKERNGNMVSKWAFKRKEWEPEHLLGKGA